MKKTIRSKQVKESIEGLSNLSSVIKENTENAVKSLLGDTVRDAIGRIVEGKEDDDLEEEEVEEGIESVDEKDTDDKGKDADKASDEWDELSDYKVGDGEYDFSGAKEEDVNKLTALLGDGDEVLVKKDGDKLEITDNERNTEYVIDLETGEMEENETEIEAEVDDDEDEIVDGPDEDEEGEDDETEFLIDLDDDDEESIEEGAVMEYDSHVGYTDNYQKKTAMTTPGNSEPGKGNDWDAGIPKGTSKPWAGSIKGKGKPFGQNVDECGNMEGLEEEYDFSEDMDEATNVGGFVQQNSTSKSHVPNSNGRKARNMSKEGSKVSDTTDPRYGTTNESVKALKSEIAALREQFANMGKIQEENKQLKEALKEFKATLNEAAVTNHSLGKIIKLITENATTNEEKREIVKRFGNEVSTIEESNKLYESFSNTLKGKEKIDINEERSMTVNGSEKLNETQIYRDPSIQNQLDLIHRMNRVGR